MEHLTQFELALIIVCAGFLFAGIANFVEKVGLK